MWTVDADDCAMLSGSLTSAWHRGAVARGGGRRNGRAADLRLRAPRAGQDPAMGAPSTGIPVRVGLVGAGGVGARHARTLAGFPDVELVGVTDAVPGAADTFALFLARRSKHALLACALSCLSPRQYRPRETASHGPHDRQHTDTCCRAARRR